MRTVKETPILFSTSMVQAILAGRKTQTRRVAKDKLLVENTDPEIEEFLLVTAKCPFGEPGDLLWVRESWAEDPDGHNLLYKASVENPDWWKWKPSIHMPKTAARIWLRIKSKRVERLHDISREDAIAEGIKPPKYLFADVCMVPAHQIGSDKLVYWDYMYRKDYHYETPEHSYQSLWESIYGPGSWDLQNPWVWVLEYEVVSTTGKENIK